MITSTRKKIFQRKMLTPWLKSIQKPAWAFGVAALGIPLLAAADFVMLGDQLSQSFGGNGQGYVVVLACLGGIVLLPIPIAYFIHSLLYRTQESQECEEAKGTRLVKIIITVMLALSLIGCFASITAYRISQAQANQEAREHTASIQATSQSETGIVLNSNLSNETQASAESQTLLLTTLLIMSSVYSFSLTWAKASSHTLDSAQQLTHRFKIATSQADTNALQLVTEIRKKEVREYLAAKTEYDTCALMLDATVLCLNTIKGPEEDHIVAERINDLLEIAEANNLPTHIRTIGSDQSPSAHTEPPITPTLCPIESNLVMEGR